MRKWFNRSLGSATLQRDAEDAGISKGKATPQKEKDMDKATKTSIMNQYARHEGDTGSPEVQVALLTHRINHLNEHLEAQQERPPQPARPAADGRPEKGSAGLS